MPEFRVGQYVIGKKIGSGNFSSVRQCADSQGREWAVKIIKKSRIEKEQMEEQFMREIAMMRKLRHPNILEIRDAFQSTEYYFIVLELVTGGELFNRIATAKRFDEDTARQYFHQLIAGVYYCHSLGCAHRDLKPENLLLDASGVLKISDFGLCNMQQNVLLQTVCGTPNYVAPEVLMGRGYNGLAADIWSCGVILFVMLAGRMPFQDRNIKILLAKVEHGDYVMAKEIPPGAKELIMHMLVVDPRKRMPLNYLIAHPWFQVGWNPQMLRGKK